MPAFLYPIPRESAMLVRSSYSIRAEAITRFAGLRTHTHGAALG
jgi:hypothetical protein